MGTSCSTTLNFIPNDRIIGQSSRVPSICEELGLNQNDIDKTYFLFSSLYESRTGLIPLAEVCRFLALQNTAFCGFVMKLFDIQNESEVNFENFIIACWNILTIDESIVGTQLFNLLDHEGHGVLLQDEIEKIVDNVLELSQGSKTIILDLFLLLGDEETGAVNDVTFNSAIMEYPCITKPVTNLRHRLRCNLFGEKRTSELSKIRNEKYGDMSLVGVIMTMKNKPYSYEMLIRNHAVEGSEWIACPDRVIASGAAELSKRCISGAFFLSESYANLDGNHNRQRITYFSPVFLMKCHSGSVRYQVAVLSKKRSRKMKGLFSMKKVNLLPTCTAVSKTTTYRSSVSNFLTPTESFLWNKRPSTSIRQDPTDQVDAKVMTETIACSSKDDALRVMMEWSAGKQGVPSDRPTGGSKSARSMKKKECLNISAKWKDPAIQLQLDNDRRAVKLIEENFWAPSSKSKDALDVHIHRTGSGGSNKSPRNAVTVYGDHSHKSYLGDVRGFQNDRIPDMRDSGRDPF